MFKKMLKNVNRKRLVMTVFAVFVFIFISDFVIHGVILSDTYKQTASLWRPEQEMHSYMLWMMIGQFLVAKFFSTLFARGYEGGGAMEGFRFGVLASPLLVAPSFVSYAVTPMPQFLLWAWVGLGLIQGLLAGVVAGLVYKR